MAARYRGWSIGFDEGRNRLALSSLFHPTALTPHPSMKEKGRVRDTYKSSVGWKCTKVIGSSEGSSEREGGRSRALPPGSPQFASPPLEEGLLYGFMLVVVVVAAVVVRGFGD